MSYPHNGRSCPPSCIIFSLSDLGSRFYKASKILFDLYMKGGSLVSRNSETGRAFMKDLAEASHLLIRSSIACSELRLEAGELRKEQAELRGEPTAATAGDGLLQLPALTDIRQ